MGCTKTSSSHLKRYKIELKTSVVSDLNKVIYGADTWQQTKIIQLHLEFCIPFEERGKNRGDMEALAVGMNL